MTRALPRSAWLVVLSLIVAGVLPSELADPVASHSQQLRATGQKTLSAFASSSAGAVTQTGLTHLAIPATSATRQPSPQIEALRTSLAKASHALRSPQASGRPRERGVPGAKLRINAARGAHLLSARAETQVGPIRHTTLQPRKSGLPVLNRSVRLHERDQRLLGWTGRSTFPPIADVEWQMDREQAVERALRVSGGGAPRANVHVERGLFAADAQTRPAWQVTVPAWEPLATWRVTLDAHSGALLEKTNLLRAATGQGVVYLEDPVSSLVTSLEPLPELTGSGFLEGSITKVFDVVSLEAFRPDLVFDFPETDPRFVQTAVYRAATETGLFALAHGFPAFARPVVAFTNLQDASTGNDLNNAFYDPFFKLLLIGNGDGNITANLGTDFDVAAHELGHHIFQTLVDPTLAGSPRALGAVNEGVADTIAALVLDDPEIGEAILPGQPQLRNIDNDALFPEDSDVDPHIEGLIYAGLNWDLAEALGVSVFADILIAGLPFLPLEEFLPHDYRDALISGDQAVTGGQNAALIFDRAQIRGLDFFEELGFSGSLEEGIPRSAFLADDAFDLYIFSEFPDSSEIRFTMTGTGDADLLVGAVGVLDFADPSTFAVSETTTSSEAITINRTGLPSVDGGDLWFVFVIDFPNGGASSYTLSVSSDLPEASIAIGGSLTDSLDEGGELDLFTFTGTAGQIVRLEALGLSQDLDVAVSIFDPVAGDFLAGDDDSGPGVDALIQGARLPVSGTYGIAVFSPIADIDPRVGTGSYRLELSACINSGPDFDSDGLADVCDDDDDDDGFRDADDIAPMAALLCQDIEADGCDDCVGGDFDPFDDGLDTDGDALCDVGDVDDDNDGCEDEIDSSPLSPSPDDDLDFVGSHCDNCPEDFNPSQLDQDDDGLGNACDPTPMPEPQSALLALAALLTLLLRKRLPTALS